jgi:hypothetical protein
MHEKFVVIGEVFRQMWEFFFFFWYWGLNSAYILSHSTILFVMGFFEIGSQELFAQANFVPRFS